jgi:hypothetical protein
MAYSIILTDGSLFATVADGTVNQASSMTLVGKNYAGYGQFLDTNFMRLLENGANNTAPAAPIAGQLWWDKTNGLLKVYNGSIFKTISAATSSAVAPSNNVQGDLWFDTVNQQLKVWTGVQFIVVGPAFSSSQGTSGALPETITDSLGATKQITSLYVDNVRVGVVSNSAVFVPQVSLQSAFPNIYPGITLSSTVTGARYEGTANNSTYFNNLTSAQFLRSDTNTSATGTVSVVNNAGISVGTTNALNLSQSANNAVVSATLSNANLVLTANVGGTPQNVVTVVGSNGVFAIGNAATVGTTLNVTGNITGGNVNTNNSLSAAGNITGSNIIAATLLQTSVLSSTGNVQAANVRTTGLVSATGNITAAGNISGNYILGNGSQLTGLSTAVSVSKIENGTSEVRIGASGGNANISIGGISNVAVFTQSTAIFAGITVPNIDKSGANAVGNIGSPSNYFNRVYATATTALYADVAERFAADEYLEPGTVVELGGSAEITRARDPLSDTVFGVISTRAAYLMNGGAGDDDTHPPVAMTGRVPVKVVGRINKGDRLVSAGDGIARAATKEEVTAFNVIGRALVAKPTDDVGIIEAIVTIK